VLEAVGTAPHCSRTDSISREGGAKGNVKAEGKQGDKRDKGKLAMHYCCGHLYNNPSK